jgi:hypothetical protein
VDGVNLQTISIPGMEHPFSSIFFRRLGRGR